MQALLDPPAAAADTPPAPRPVPVAAPAAPQTWAQYFEATADSTQETAYNIAANTLSLAAPVAGSAVVVGVVAPPAIPAAATTFTAAVFGGGAGLIAATATGAVSLSSRVLGGVASLLDV